MHSVGGGAGGAYHYRRCGDQTKALKYLELAGQQGLARCAYREAERHYSDALAILNALPESSERDRCELTLQLALGFARLTTRTASAETGEAYARARILAERAGGAQSVQAFFGPWLAANVRGEHRAALALADQMLEIARGVGGAVPLTMGHYAQAALDIFSAIWRRRASISNRQSITVAKRTFAIFLTTYE